MRTPSPQPPGPNGSIWPERIEQSAADWVARCDRGLNAREEAELQAWVSRDPRHAALFSQLRGTWSALNEPRVSGRAPLFLRQIQDRRLVLNRQHRRRTIALAGASMLATAALIVAGLFEPFKHRPASLPTVVLRPDRRDLPDGSFVELNTGAEITVAFSDVRRGVVLLQGEALFTVKADPSRPFVVNAGGVDVRAVGTAFSVQKEATRVSIMVTQGAVAVERSSDGASLLSPGAVPAGAVPSSVGPRVPELAAGQRIAVPVAAASANAVEVNVVSAEQIAEALAWRQRRVEFTGTRLADAVQLFNRQNTLQLTFADPALGESRISGVFWTDDPEGFARLLASSLSVRSRRETNDTLILEK
jgi:transmembrane sensor